METINHRQLSSVAFQITRQTLTQRGCIARIGLHPGAFVIEFTRGNHIAMCAGGDQLPIKGEAKATRFINHMHAVTLA